MAFWNRKKSEQAPASEPTTAKRSAAFSAARISKRMFEATKQDRLNGDWLTMPVTAEWVIRQHQRVLVARSREQAANNDYARAFVRMCRQNIVGPKGVMLQAQSRDSDGKLDTRANEAIEAAWQKWARRDNCDITGVQSWRSLQASAISSAAKDGEFMFRKIYGRDAGPFGFALQALDPQRVNPQFDQFDLPDGKYIRAGIEFNRYGKPLAFHFSAAKESDAYYNYTYSGNHYHRIPADEIIHGFIPDMVGQKRGLPWMATSLFRMKQLVGFEDAAIVNARVGAAKMGFIEWKEGHGPEIDEDEAQHLEMDGDPGTFPVLPEGAQLKEWTPQYPSGEFAVFNKAMLRGIAAGLGVAYNNLANDLEGVNFSSIRSGTLDEREYWKELQEWLTETLIQPVFDEWLPRALLAGLIKVGEKPLKPERLDKYAEVAWQPRRWQWIDPQADVNSAVTAKNNLLQSPSQIIREQGRDPGDVWREIGADIAEMRAAGIPEEYIKAAVLDKNFAASKQADTAEKMQKSAAAQ